MPTEDTLPQHGGTLVPLTTERDYALEAKEQAEKLQVNEELHKFFLKLFEIEKQDNKEWLEIKRNWIKARKYFDGKQFGYVSDGCQWYDYARQPGQVIYKDNVYHAHIQTALTELSKAEPQLSFSHVAKESRRGQLIARVAEARYRTHRMKTFDALKLQQEHLSQLLNGVAARYTYFNRNRKEKTPVFGDKETSGESAKVCAECTAPMKENYCYNCGSDKSEEMSFSATAKVITGYEDSTAGDSDWVSVDPIGLNWYLYASNLKDSPWMIWKQAILVDVLQSRYPETPIKEGIESRELNYQFASDNAPHAGNGYSIDGNSQGKRTTELVQGWFDPAMYANFVVKRPTKLKNGTVIPAGTKLGDVFPDGLYLCKNGQNILDVWNEDKCCKWTVAPYVTRPGTLVGAGTSVALDDQDTKNDLRNLHMASIYHNAFPKKFVNGTLISPDEIPEGPEEWGVITTMPENGKIVGQGVDVLPGMPLTPDAYQIEERIDASMQMKLGTFSGSSLGAPDLQAVKNTASAFLAWRNMTIGRYGPALAAAADALDVKQAYQMLENDQKYLTPDQWKKYSDDYSADAVKAFINCDLKEELVIEVVGESYMPSDADSRRAKTEGYLAAIVQAQVEPQSQMGAYIAGQYDIPKTIVGFDVSESAVYAMLDAVNEQVMGILNELPDIPTFSLDFPAAEQLAELILSEAHIELEPQLDDIPSMVEALKDHWAKDECRTSSNLYKASAALLLRKMNEAVIRKSQEDQEMAMEAQAPAMQAAAAQQKAQAEAESAGDEAQRAHEQEQADREDARAEQDLQARTVEAGLNAEEADKSREHESSMASLQAEEAEKQRQHDAMMADKQIEMKKLDAAKAKKTASKSSK